MMVMVFNWFHASHPPQEDIKKKGHRYYLRKSVREAETLRSRKAFFFREVPHVFCLCAALIVSEAQKYFPNFSSPLFTLLFEGRPGFLLFSYFAS